MNVTALAFDPGDTDAESDDRLLALYRVNTFEVTSSRLIPTTLRSPILGQAQPWRSHQWFPGARVRQRERQALHRGVWCPSASTRLITTCPSICARRPQVPGISVPRPASSLAYSERDRAPLRHRAAKLAREPCSTRLMRPHSRAFPTIGIDDYTPGGLAAIPVPEPHPLILQLVGGLAVAGLIAMSPAQQNARVAVDPVERSAGVGSVERRRRLSIDAGVGSGKCRCRRGQEILVEDLHGRGVAFAKFAGFSGKDQQSARAQHRAQEPRNPDCRCFRATISSPSRSRSTRTKWSRPACFWSPFREPGADRRPEERSAPGHLAQCGPDELLEGHHRGYRIAGQAECERAVVGFEATGRPAGSPVSSSRPRRAANTRAFRARRARNPGLRPKPPQS